MRRFLPSQNFARTSLVPQVADGTVYPGSRLETNVMDIAQVAPKVGCATVVCKDFATNAALDMLLIALLEVLPNTRPLRPWDSYGLQRLLVQ